MCPFSQNPDCRVQKKGFFAKRSTRAERIQRFRCKDCRRSFSSRTNSLTYRERKPHLDQPLFRLLASGVSQRRCARILDLHRVTVARKLVRLARFAREENGELDPQRFAETGVAVFDEMETFEHTKMKPLSIAVAVQEKSRLILTAKVAIMPAKGLLAARSRRKYGTRRDDRREAIETTLAEVKRKLPSLTKVKSDKSPRYPSSVARVLPGIEHQTFKGRRGCVVGLGELKAGGFDPLFALNHSCAMIRDNIKRLSRRTWCTTKRPDRLQALLELYIRSHNAEIVRPGKRVVIGSGPI